MLGCMATLPFRHCALFHFTIKLFTLGIMGQQSHVVHLHNWRVEPVASGSSWPTACRLRQLPPNGLMAFQQLTPPAARVAAMYDKIRMVQPVNPAFLQRDNPRKIQHPVLLQAFEEFSRKPSSLFTLKNRQTRVLFTLYQEVFFS